MSIFVEDAAEAITASYVEAGDLLRNGDRWRQRVQRAGVGDALVRPVPVVELLELLSLNLPRWFRSDLRGFARQFLGCRAVAGRLYLLDAPMVVKPLEPALFERFVRLVCWSGRGRSRGRRIA
jgi:hypothetical protein